MSGAVSKAFARAGAFCCANDIVATSRTVTTTHSSSDRFIDASNPAALFADKTRSVFCIPAALIHRHFRILAHEPLPHGHAVFIVVEHQFFRGLSSPFPLLNDA